MTDRRQKPTEGQIDNAKLAEQLLYSKHETGDPFAAAIRGTRMAMIVTDPRQEDNPIIFANDSFCRLTGYHHDELIGRNCRFLQGPETNPRDIAALNRAVEREEDVHVEIMNYRKDGTPFWNSLFISPVRNDDGEVVFFFGSQLDVSNKKQTEFALHSVNDELRETKTLLEQQIDDRTAELMRLLAQRSRLVNELDHRVKNNLQLISSLLGFELRNDLGEEARELVTRLHQRVDALGLAHRDQHNKDAIGYFRVDNFIRVLIGKILVQHEQWEREPRYALDQISLPIGKAAPLALALNEFVRALLGGVDSSPAGDNLLIISATTRNGRLLITISSRNLVRSACQDALDAVEPWTVKLLEKQLNAQIDFVDDDNSCGVVLTMPVNGTHDEER
ncbi:PAS domain-containing protein [Pararhizobium haloflavum]|uniref:PAS domain-containing protein n=1 Tax=Pararhizobium haloflavum TaxID=2037914 RepID=UPI000C176C61|nr:PAS domain-containing protein [Pararhizobium haloflavum]